MWRPLILLAGVGLTGCTFLPEIAHQPTIHNPYPQLSKVAVAPFFNLSSEPTVDGRQYALAYFNELQLVPGFEVLPVGVVERAMSDQQLTLGSPEDARRLAQLLGVDALVVGAVTDYSPYYPPRCGLQVEWYAANPCFHPIPPGYGLPWGTPEEEGIPGPLVFEAEMALAKEQLRTQTPSYVAASFDPSAGRAASGTERSIGSAAPGESSTPQAASPNGGQLVYDIPSTNTTVTNRAIALDGPGIPEDWPDPRGFISPPPSPQPPACRPSGGPVIRHTRTYNGHDPEFTEALASYYFFRDDARFGGWQGYLERSDDLIRFCCHMHIWEMLSARGGAGETRVVWRWPEIR